MNMYEQLGWAFYSLEGRFTGIAPRRKVSGNHVVPVSDACLDAARDLAFALNRTCIQALKPESTEHDAIEVVKAAHDEVCEYFTRLSDVMAKEDVQSQPEFVRDRVFVVLAVARELRSVGFNLDQARSGIQGTIASALRSNVSLLRVAVLHALKASVSNPDVDAPETPELPAGLPLIDPADLPSKLPPDVRPHDVPAPQDPPTAPRRKPLPVTAGTEVPLDSPDQSVRAALSSSLAAGVRRERSRGKDWIVQPMRPLGDSATPS